MRRRPHIGEYNSAVFVYRIGALRYFFSNRTANRLGRRINQPTVNVEVPAVIAALDTTIHDDAKFQ